MLVFRYVMGYLEIVDLYFLIIIFSYHNFDNFVNSRH